MDLPTEETGAMARDLHRAIRAEAHHILMPAIGAGAMDGGCLIVARAIARAVPGARVVTMMGDPGGGWRPEHYGAVVGGLIVDGDGPARSPGEWVARFARLESVRWPLRFEGREVPSSEIPRDEGAVSALGAALAAALHRGGHRLIAGMADGDCGAAVWMDADELPGSNRESARAGAAAAAGRLGVAIRLLGPGGGGEMFLPGAAPGPGGEISVLLLGARMLPGAPVAGAVDRAAALAGRSGAAVLCRMGQYSVTAIPGEDPGDILDSLRRRAGRFSLSVAGDGRAGTGASPLGFDLLCSESVPEEEACAAAVSAARGLGGPVVFHRAGVRCVARDLDDPAAIAGNLRRSRGPGAALPFASAGFPAGRAGVGPSGRDAGSPRPVTEAAAGGGRCSPEGPLANPGAVR